MKRNFLVFCFASVLAAIVSAQDLDMLIDVPSANIAEYGGYTARFRFYSQGGLLTRVAFGVLNRVNIGFSWDLEEVIGSETIDVNEPALNVKIRFFDGTIILPALALGYDGQGYFFDETTDEYSQREKGVYLAATQELFFPKLEWTLGGNIFDFAADTVYGFTGLTYTIYPLVIVAEYDNIHIIDENRLNAGIAILLSPSISVDIAGRDIGAADRDAERIIRINYRGLF